MGWLWRAVSNPRLAYITEIANVPPSVVTLAIDHDHDEEQNRHDRQ
jgi:hypothetical protein